MNSNWSVQNRYIDVKNSLYQILVITSYLVYILLKIRHFTELKRWHENQKGRLRLDERLMYFVTYLLCHSLWETICYKKWYPETLGIFTTPEIAVVTHFHAQHGTRITPIFLPGDWESFQLLLPSLVSLLSCGTKSTYFDFLKVAGQVSQNQKKDKH